MSHRVRPVLLATALLAAACGGATAQDSASPAYLPPCSFGTIHAAAERALVGEVLAAGDDAEAMVMEVLVEVERAPDCGPCPSPEVTCSACPGDTISLVDASGEESFVAADDQTYANRAFVYGDRHGLTAGRHLVYGSALEGDIYVRAYRRLEGDCAE